MSLLGREARAAYDRLTCKETPMTETQLPAHNPDSDGPKFRYELRIDWPGEGGLTLSSGNVGPRGMAKLLRDEANAIDRVYPPADTTRAVPDTGQAGGSCDHCGNTASIQTDGTIAPHDAVEGATEHCPGSETFDFLVPCGSCGHTADHSGGCCMWFDDVQMGDDGWRQIECKCTAAGRATEEPRPCRESEGMTGIDCGVGDEGHPLPHRGWWCHENDMAGEHAFYIEWPVPDRPNIAALAAPSGDTVQAPDVAALRSALAELVALKDGPRDARYRRRKDLAWSNARRALLGADTTEETDRA